MERQDTKRGSIRGIATIRKVGDAWQVDLTHKVDGREKKERFEFAAEDAPKGAQAGKWSVSISGKGDRWYAIGPVDGTYKVKYVGMGGSRPGTPPKPMFFKGGIKQGPNGPFEAEDSFSLLILTEVVTGASKGMQVALFLPYPFGETETGMTKLTGTSGQNEKVEQLFAAFEVSPNIPFSDNVCPALDKVLKGSKATPEVMVEDGKFKKFVGLELEEEDAAPAPRKKARAEAR